MGQRIRKAWLRNRNTLEYLGIWERIHNPDSNYGEFAIIKSQAGLNNYKISVKERAEKTNAIGLNAKAGRYGGTYAHQAIAFEFGVWISADFKIYLVKEFQQLKAQEQNSLDWNVKRSLTKINYRIHTDAVKEHLMPEHLPAHKINLSMPRKRMSSIWRSLAKLPNNGGKQTWVKTPISETMSMCASWCVLLIWKTSMQFGKKKGNHNPTA